LTAYGIDYVLGGAELSEKVIKNSIQLKDRLQTILRLLGIPGV